MSDQNRVNAAVQIPYTKTNRAVRKNFQIKYAAMLNAVQEIKWTNKLSAFPIDGIYGYFSIPFYVFEETGVFYVEGDLNGRRFIFAAFLDPTNQCASSSILLEQSISGGWLASASPVIPYFYGQKWHDYLTALTLK